MSTLHPGTRLGPYEIVAPIGSCGMGEVFKARDVRLERSVAIKILPAEFAQNAQLKLRLEREAKTISQLNHPNICALYDVGHENGTDYLVMELCEGESLADRLSRGPLPIAQVLHYGIQIADALDKAHKRGIVHRDLKPANIMVTPSTAKLLDFGLAKNASGPVVQALTSNESGRPEIFVQSFPATGAKWQISTQGGLVPRWRGDGKELFYMAGDSWMMSVPIRATPDTLEPGSPVPLFSTRPRGSGLAYDVAADGQRFLINTLTEDETQEPITIVQNWTAELKDQ